MSILTYQVVVLCLVLLVKITASSAGKPGSSEADADEKFPKNFAYRSIINLRKRNGVLKELSYDLELDPETKGKFGTSLSFYNLTEALDESTNHSKFWNSVIEKLNTGYQKFLASQWDLKEITEDEAKTAAQIFIFVVSPLTQGVFMNYEVTDNDTPLAHDKYSASMYFFPPLSSETMTSAVTFKYMDSLFLLNACRAFFKAPPLFLHKSSGHHHKATLSTNALLVDFKNLIREHHENEIIQSTNTNGQKHNKLFRFAKVGNNCIIFAYTLPNDAELHNSWFTFPYTVIKDVIFTEYKNSITEFEQDVEFYTQIRKEVGELMNPSITEVDIMYENFGYNGRKYCLLIFNYEYSKKYKANDISSLDVAAKEDAFNFNYISTTAERFGIIKDHIGSLTPLNLKHNLIKFNSAILKPLAEIYKPTIQT